MHADRDEDAFPTVRGTSVEVLARGFVGLEVRVLDLETESLERRLRGTLSSQDARDLADALRRTAEQADALPDTAPPDPELE
jgi:hypothetical protein